MPDDMTPEQGAEWVKKLLEGYFDQSFRSSFQTIRKTDRREYGAKHEVGGSRKQER